MKEHIDTIPVWDAYRSDCECPLCQIRHKTERMYVENFLGASVMEPEHRVEVNKKGFCKLHNKMMYDAGNRLGLALMTDTYLKETIERLRENAKQAAKAISCEGGRALLARRMGREDALSGMAAQAQAIHSTCILCERLEATMDRYVYTLIYLWEHEREFRDVFAGSKGLCLEHYAQVLDMARREMRGAGLREFVEVLVRVESENLCRIEKELEWFTLKFDYRNKDKPWGSSQDAVERAINKLRGECV